MEPLAVAWVDQVRANGVRSDVVGVVGAVLEDLVDDPIDEGGVGSRTDWHEFVALGTGDCEAGIDRDEPGTVLVPASHMIRQSGIEVSATLLAQKTIVFALMKSTDS